MGVSKIKLLEYKARELFVKAGIDIPKGFVIDNLDDLEAKLESLKLPLVVKAQVQAGGRGKAGGIRFAENFTQAIEISKELLYSTIKGLKVNQLLLVENVSGIKECYLSIVLDRLYKAPMVIFSAQGGVDIEETARTNPGKIVKVPVNPLVGIKEYMIRHILDKSGLCSDYYKNLYTLLKKLYQIFNEYDCLLTEINPLLITAGQKFVALDGKIDVDDNALYRQAEILEFRDSLQEDELVLEARKYNFLLIPIENDGDIAIMSNGSGMIMSCIDLISKEGLKVGMALDLGGGATAERIAEAIRIMLSKAGIKQLFISIFGGITRCDEVATGVRLALTNQFKEKQVVIRVEGTNKEKGLAIIQNIDGRVTTVDSIQEGVKELVEGRKLL